MRNFDFKRYTPRPKKLLRASLSSLLSSRGWIVRSEVLQSGLALLAAAHSSLNPFIYAFQSKNLRRHIRRITKRRKQQVDVEKTAERINCQR